jgi:hypothetical protein
MPTKKRIIVIPLLGVLAGVFVTLVAIGLIPPRRYYNPHAYRNACIANLKQIEGAKATWYLENCKHSSTLIPTATDLYGENAYIRDEPMCPQGGKYVIGSFKEKARCSIPGHTL